METKNQPDDEQVRELLLEFAELGRQARKLKGNPKPIAKNELDRITRRICEIASQVVGLSQHMGRHNEYLQIFSAAAIIASAATEDPELEQRLMTLSSRISKQAPE